MNVSTLIRFPILLGVCLLGLTACDSLDSRLKDVNTDPTVESDLNPEFQLTGVQLKAAGGRFESWRNNLIYNSTMIQHFATLAGYWSGDKYLYISSYTGAAWSRWYPGAVREVVDLERRTDPEENPTMVNRNAVARIMSVVVFHRLSDLYGDIPYSEAGLAFYEGTNKPKYDQQQAIYDDMLTELDEAVDQFDASQPMYGDGDLMYTGDIEQWKRFANSLMLRLALRMVKVDNAKAQQWAKTALENEGGVMQSNDDIASVPHQEGTGLRENGNGQVFDFLGPPPPYMSDTFVDWMKSKNDPRLRVYGEDDGDPAVGLPNGYDDDGQMPIQEHSSWVECSGSPAPDPCGLDVYMKPNEVLLGLDDPTFFQTYAEVEFMKAEAQLRWGLDPDGVSAEQHYRDGVRAALNYLSMYGSDADIPAADVDSYVNDLSWGSTMEARLRQINNQYWAAVFYSNEYEAWSNWRRTGYPDLTPTNYPGNRTNGRIPRRMIYPQGEASVNAQNYNEAVSRYENGDSFMSRMWWDVKQ